MKKNIILMLLILASITITAQDIDVSAGYKFSLKHQSLSIESGLVSSTGSLLMVFNGLFVDTTYAQLGITYSANATQQTTTMSLFGGPATTTEGTGLAMGFLDFELLGQYPVQIGDRLTVYPAAGFRYAMIVLAKQDDVDKLTDQVRKNSNDLFLVLGGGAEFAIHDSVYIRGQVQGDINLTTTDEGMPSDFKTSGYAIGGGIYIGYKF